MARSERKKERKKKRTYLVRLVVVLRIILKNLGLLNIIEVADEIIGAKLFPPFFAINKPDKISLSPYTSLYTDIDR